MPRQVAIGIQDFRKLREADYFYIDKTLFIKEWWESGDDVTLITRPRRFGKTLNMSMVQHFFSLNDAGRGDLFEGLMIWEEEKYRGLQGTYPVVSVSFADVKMSDYQAVKKEIYHILVDLYEQNRFLLESGILAKTERKFFESVTMDMDEVTASKAIRKMCKFLYNYYGEKVIVLLDEYDTPMQEAYVNDYWKELTAFTRSFFNATFKTNPYMERGLMTGITRVSKESIFSDLNNLEVVTTTTDKYAAAFGFMEEEVFAALEEYGLGAQKKEVKHWYDGFVFGKHWDIYNPWSILNLLDKGKLETYWANTSSNSLISKLIREGSEEVKKAFERLLKGGHLWCPLDEQIVYNQLDNNEEAIWSLLVASGYLKVVNYEVGGQVEEGEEPFYELMITNYETEQMFRSMVRGWFKPVKTEYNYFIKAMLLGDKKAMNTYMNRVTMQTFSFFDTGKSPWGAEPERFYHGFVLGLLVDLNSTYVITSNRESGFGRYDVMLEPKCKEDDAFILEFKVHDAEEAGSLEDTVAAALAQIEEKQYEAALIARGVPAKKIRKYGFAFDGKKVRIG